jgi:predicted dehydrogenase
MIHFFGTSYKATGVSGNLSHVYKVDDATSGSILFDNEVLFSGVWWFSCSPEHAKDCCEIVGTKAGFLLAFFDWKPIVVEVGDKKETIN